MTVHGFWGLRVEPGKRYSQIIKAPIHVTMASLVDDDTTGDTSRTSIYADIENKSFALCTLIPSKIKQQLLDIYFVQGEAVTFMANGQHPICLTGNYVFPDIEPTLDTTNTILKSTRENQGHQHKPDMSLSSPTTKNESNNGNNGKKGRLTQKREQEANEPKIVAFPDKLTVKDIQIGAGPACIIGQKVKVLYDGKFINGKTFIQRQQPRYFELGKEKMIKAMELGIVGMKAGGRRVLTIPSSLAYGTRGYPPLIPQNATLIFDIQLVSIE